MMVFVVVVDGNGKDLLSVWYERLQQYIFSLKWTLSFCFWWELINVRAHWSKGTKCMAKIGINKSLDGSPTKHLTYFYGERPKTWQHTHTKHIKKPLVMIVIAYESKVTTCVCVVVCLQIVFHRKLRLQPSIKRLFPLFFQSIVYFY